jgi:hypothetical protein
LFRNLSKRIVPANATALTPLGIGLGCVRAGKESHMFVVTSDGIVTEREEATGHSARFRRVANRYPRRVAEAYGGDIEAAAADSNAATKGGRHERGDDSDLPSRAPRGGEGDMNERTRTEYVYPDGTYKVVVERWLDRQVDPPRWRSKNYRVKLKQPKLTPGEIEYLRDHPNQKVGERR